MKPDLFSRLPLLGVLLAGLAAGQSWTPQISGTTASLRGVSAVSSRIAWASGSKGTILRTVDGGATWVAVSPPGAAELDFRDIEAFSEHAAVAMSAGPGDRSRIYRTTDGGASWELVFENPDAKGFFDSIAFWTPQRGILVGDAVNGRAAVFTTRNGGLTWRRQRPPAALEGEGSFAASGTCVIAGGQSTAWFVTGGKGAARVFRSTNGGLRWTAAPAPVRADGPAAGIFSVGFSGLARGVVVGGDYQKPGETAGNAALSDDGGRTWRPPSGTRPEGFRSAVVWVAGIRKWIAAGPTGSDDSPDGETWTPFDATPLNALSFAADGSGWGVGPNGRIARFHE